MGGCLFDGVKPHMRIYREEIFGPVLCVLRAAQLRRRLNPRPIITNTVMASRSFTRNGAIARDFASRVSRSEWLASMCQFPTPLAYHPSAVGNGRSRRSQSAWSRRNTLLHENQDGDVPLAKRRVGRRGELCHAHDVIADAMGSGSTTAGEQMMSRIAFIGLGNMGGPMAANLARAGYDPRGFDPLPAVRDSAAKAGVKVAFFGARGDGRRRLVVTMLPAGACCPFGATCWRMRFPNDAPPKGRTTRPRAHSLSTAPPSTSIARARRMPWRVSRARARSTPPSLAGSRARKPER